MEIIVAPDSGFCFGVERNIKLALSAIPHGEKKNKKKPIYSLGPLIHNPQVVKDLEKQGIKVVSKLANIEKGTLIIRSHGVPPALLEEAKRKKFKIIDATCPFVQRAQKLVSQMVKHHYKVVIVGDSSHPEVLSLLGFSYGQGTVISDPGEVDKITFSLKIGVVAQTTQSIDNFRDVVAKLVTKTKELKVHNTICEATMKRRESAKIIAGEVDLMLVIGGYNSANTTRLAEICRQENPHTCHIETLKDLDLKVLKGKKKIGISAGASTPAWIIKEIVEELTRLTKKLEKNGGRKK
ncbi:MAG: 4-hydroxy-3-methylbut-2-enyl diphosphate reductase [bacterium]